MKDDFVKEMGYIGLTTRLKRISDVLMHEGRKLYDALDVDIEPNWYLVFKLLKSYGPLSVTEIANRLGMAHPSIITIINKMMDTGYLDSVKDKDDSRKRVLSLSEKAIKKLPEYEKIWEAGRKGMEIALDGMNALEFITTMEERFYHKGFKERTLEQLNLESHGPVKP